MKYFSGKFEPFRENMAKMMNYIDLDTPSHNRCGTFKYFRAALETYLQVGPPYRWFQSRWRIFMKFAKLSTVQDEECPKVLFYV